MSSCQCTCDDGVYPSVYNESFPKARKEYKCCECGEVIRKGEKYQYVNGLWGGDWDYNRTCMICCQIREDYAPRCCFGELRETIWECMGIDYLGKWGNDEE